MSVRAAYERLVRHPCALVFMYPLTDTGYVGPEYAKVIPRSMDFETIKSRLDSEGYTMKKFKADVNLIAKNAIKYFGEDSEFGACAEELVKILAKVACDDLSSWGKRANHLKNRIGKILLERPTMVRGAFVTDIDRAKNIDAQLVSRQEMEAFIKATESLTDKRSQDAMIQIIETMEPNLRPGKPTNLRIDVVEMKVSTLRALINFAKSAFEKAGRPYPE